MVKSLNSNIRTLKTVNKYVDRFHKVHQEENPTFLVFPEGTKYFVWKKGTICESWILCIILFCDPKGSRHHFYISRVIDINWKPTIGFWREEKHCEVFAEEFFNPIIKLTISSHLLCFTWNRMKVIPETECLNAIILVHIEIPQIEMHLILNLISYNFSTWVLAAP